MGIGVGVNGQILFRCYAGCSYDQIRDALLSKGVEQSDIGSKPPAPTVGSLAFDKRLPFEFLKSIGLRNLEDGDGVGIPYWNELGDEIGVKRRTANEAKKGSFWPKGVPLAMYGLWMLPDKRPNKQPLFMVEGESDCWTLWHHGYAAIGVPGANAGSAITSEALAGFGLIYAWREPGKSGSTFLLTIAKRLKKIGYTGRVEVIYSEHHKDPNALHQSNPAAFVEHLTEIVSLATKLPSVEMLEESNKPTPKATLAAMEGSKNLPVPEGGYFGFTDSGNAMRLVFRHGTNIRFCFTWDSWLVWDGKRWCVDNTQEIRRLAYDTVVAINAEAESTPDTAEGKTLREQIRAHAKLSESKRARVDMIDLAQSIEGIPILSDVMDKNPMQFNVANGTIDLANGKLLVHRQEDYNSKMSSVNYDPEAECPTFLAFLDRIFAGDSELIEFIQCAAGYSMTGLVSEKCLFFLYGTGNNGKSTLVEVLMAILGDDDYALKTTAETVLASGRSGAIPNDVARLQGIRFASTSEMDEGRFLDEAKVKDMTGGDTITARFMRGEWFSFPAEFKIWMYGNHEPIIRNGDEGIWTRIRKVPFTVSIPKAEQDADLRSKLKLEYEGILTWMVQGCLKWQQKGLPTPRAVVDATAEYREEMDILADFINEKCDVYANATCTTAELYLAYTHWCSGQNQKPISKREFSMKLRGRPGVSKRDTEYSRGWAGITIKRPTRKSEREGEFSFEKWDG